MTFTYQQPHFYHFDEDSVLLSKFVVSEMKNSDPVKLLDAFAGCGIVGIEIAKYLALERLSFCEKQRSFKPHLEANIALSKNNLISDVLIDDFQNISIDQYDIIVLNPPYFISENSRISQNVNTAICRSFEKSKYKQLIDKINSELTHDQNLFMSFRIDIESELSSRILVKNKVEHNKTKFYHLTSSL